MKHTQKLLATACLGLALSAGGPAQGNPSIIPAPLMMEARPGAFRLGAGGVIATSDATTNTAQYLAEQLKRRLGLDLVVKPGTGTAGAAIILTMDPAAAGEAEYKLSVAPQGVTIRASGETGLFYGAQSLLQLLPTEGGADDKQTLPCVEISDAPRFKWRGLMLDVARHFFSKQEVEDLLDEMAWYKLNVFHWHLTDDQGWRVEIKKYPRLTELGAWRTNAGFGLDPKKSTAYGADGRYGGFYTQD